jgi:hypothetical protein
MNRKNLTAAVLAGLAGAVGIVGSAQAVNVNPDGLGQVLLYPYYTTNGGNLTVLSVVNTSEDAKAVKVRFLEGDNSREVLDFNLYMSAYDVWTAAIILAESEAKDADGDLLFPGKIVPTLLTTDTSCTVPYIYGYGGSQEFLPWALDDAEYLDKPYKSTKVSGVYGDIGRGAEGHFEMIEMGTLVDDTTNNAKWVNKTAFPYCETGSPVVFGNPSGACTAPTGAPVSREWTSAELAQPKFLVTEGSATAATHKNGVPKDCAQLVDAWTENGDGIISSKDGYWIQDNFVDIEAPSGGLFGGAAIVNVNAGTMYSYDAKAIDGFWVHNGNYVGDDSHQEPGTILPSLDSGNNNNAAIFLNGQTFNDWGLERGVDAVSFVLMHDAIMNEYTTESAVGASTEWVVTFPTKQFYVHQAFLDDYEDTYRTGNNQYYDNQRDASGNIIPGTFVPIAPFTSAWEWVQTIYYTSGSAAGEVRVPGYVDYPCEVVQLATIWDREEREIVDPDAPPGAPVPPIVSPAPPPTDDPDPDALIPFDLCYETSVIQFGDPDTQSTILGSTRLHTIDNTELGFQSGWARLDLWNATWDADESGAIENDEIEFRDDLGGLNGLPVSGFSVNRFENAFLGDGADVLANYGGIFQHKGTRKAGSDN